MNHAASAGARPHLTRPRLIAERNPFTEWQRECIGRRNDAIRTLYEARVRLYGAAGEEWFLEWGLREFERTLAGERDDANAELARTEWLNRLLPCSGERLFCDDALAHVAHERRRRNIEQAVGGPKRESELQYLNAIRDFLAARRAFRDCAEKSRLARIAIRGGIARLTDADHREIAEIDHMISWEIDHHEPPCGE